MISTKATSQRPPEMSTDVPSESRFIHPRDVVNKAREVRRRMPRSLKIKLKILFSLVMFASLFLVGKVDLHKTWQAALQTNPWVLSATMGVFLFSVIVAARRWQLIARAVGFQKKLSELVKYCYVGLFFNLFLPSTVGGDFSRCYYMSRGTGRYADAFYSVVADRASGIAVLFLSASLGILLSPGASSLPDQLKWPVFAGTFGVFVVLPFVPWLSRKVFGESNWISRQFNTSNASIFWKDKPLVAAALMWSIVVQLLLVVCHMGVGIALGLEIPLWYYFVFYPAVAVLGFITPSFNGIGIREWAYTYFLMIIGIDRAHALTYALMWLGMTTLISLFGGLVYVLSHMSPPPPQPEDV